MKPINPGLPRCARKDHGQRASVLISTLILLVMLTVLALASMSLNTTQTRMAGNTVDAQVAYQTAEAALHAGVADLQAGNYTLADFIANANGLYTLSAAASPRWTMVDWTSATEVVLCSNCGAGTQAAYLIEYLPPVVVPGSSAKNAYRITTRALGVSGKSPVMLQATVLTGP